MANNFTLKLDTTGPASPTVQIESGATFATNQLVNLTIGTTDTPTTGYQMKVWGTLDLTQAKADGLVGAGAAATAESDALWITYVTAKQVKLASGDGAKTVYVKIRDDVFNESGQASDSITLDTTIPVVSITGPDVSKISKQATKNTCAFSFTVDTDFVEYKVKIVASAGAAHTTGAQIGTASGSTNMSGTGAYTTGTPISCTIKGTDLETASAGDGDKIIKVFVKDSSDLWSV